MCEVWNQTWERLGDGGIRFRSGPNETFPQGKDSARARHHGIDKPYLKHRLRASHETGLPCKRAAHQGSNVTSDFHGNKIEREACVRVLPDNAILNLFAKVCRIERLFAIIRSQA